MLAGLSRPLAPLAGLALGALGLMAFAVTTAQAPALREDLQVEGVAGSVRVADLPAMYDHGAYLHQTGYGYLIGNLFVITPERTVAMLPRPENWDERFAVAGELFTESLRLDPANGAIWTSHAHALVAQDDLAGARDALVRSWELAPVTQTLADRRLSLVSQIREITGDIAAHEDMVASDTRVLDAHAPDRAPGS